jgi:hypothetical protein
MAQRSSAHSLLARRDEDANTHVPRDGVEGGPQVEEEHGSLAAGRERRSRVIGRVLDVVVRRDREHGDGTAGSTDKELFERMSRQQITYTREVCCAVRHLRFRDDRSGQ